MLSIIIEFQTMRSRRRVAFQFIFNDIGLTKGFCSNQSLLRLTISHSDVQERRHIWAKEVLQARWKPKGGQEQGPRTKTNDIKQGPRPKNV